jgi:hypothetical protein
MCCSQTEGFVGRASEGMLSAWMQISSTVSGLKGLNGKLHNFFEVIQQALHKTVTNIIPSSGINLQQ